MINIEKILSLIKVWLPWFMVAILLIILLQPCKKPNITAPVVVTPKEIKKEVARNEDASKKVQDSLARIIDSAHQENTTIREKLQSSQRRARILEAKLNAELNNPAQPASQEAKDMAIDLTNDAINRDSLCNEQAANYEVQLKAKDELISAKDSLYASLKSSLDKSLDAQQKLMDYSKLLKRSVRRKSVGNFIWKAAAIGAGVFILKTHIQ